MNDLRTGRIIAKTVEGVVTEVVWRQPLTLQEARLFLQRNPYIHEKRRGLQLWWNDVLLEDRLGGPGQVR